MRKRINRAVVFREASREVVKLGFVIKSVLGTQTKRFLITYMRTPEENMLPDQTEMHDMVTNHFDE